MLCSVISLVLVFITSFCVAESSNYAPFAISLPAFSKECLYHDLLNAQDELVVGYQVLTGGNFEIDFDITAPDGSVIISERQKKYSDFLLKSFGIGQYKFCFTNTHGTAVKKVEVTLEMEKNALNNKQEKPEDVITNHAIEEIDRNLNKMRKMMDYLRAREWRNMSTVQSTESRLVWLSVLTMGIMAGISILQATVVHFMFKDRQRNYV
ncbi:unnamed protein product [Kluyveromyces dobzhanskii CBS 2104]|uniref:WGS project CCBQ000000000 data, contig 00102 n=1 Tax=Kluyveromyces dobzhanskii CBS 2104 TaxID=1427455 RepID=A0A0A8L4U6_9SACH|nr:unnamed protein product [Kluyveromyces dobzhanskii CBS 2104]